MKNLASSNWLEIDEQSKDFPGVRSREQADHWVDRVLGLLKLSEDVPTKIQDLFMVAKAAFIYGCLFYPFFSLAMEKFLITAEAAVKHKCAELNAPNSKNTFEKRIDWLHEKGMLSKEDREAWHIVRQLRNSVAGHPDFQVLATPGGWSPTIRMIEELINGLFTKGAVAETRKGMEHDPTQP